MSRLDEEIKYLDEINQYEENKKFIKSQRKFALAYEQHEYELRKIKKEKIGRFFDILMAGVLFVGFPVGTIFLANEVNKKPDKEKDPIVITDDITKDNLSNNNSNNNSTFSEDIIEENQEKIFFTKDSIGAQKVDDYLQTDLGEYISLTSEKYGFDGALSMAHLYHESWGGKHIDVLPENYASLLTDEEGNSYVDTGAIVVPGDDGFNVFNGSNYGIGQLTLDGSVVTGEDVITGDKKTLVMNMETALNVFNNIEIAMMLNQDNLNRIYYLLESEYKQCVGNNVEIREDQVLNASFLSYLQCYNYGLPRMMEIYDNYNIFDENGTFNFDNFQKGIDDVHDHPERYFGENTTETAYGSNTYINSILAICPKENVDIYFKAHNCYYTFNISKSPDKMVDYSNEKGKTL